MAKKSIENAKKPNFSAFWRRVCGVRDVPGEGFREGKHENIGDTCGSAIRCWCLVFDVAVDDGSLARRAPPTVGGGLKTPGGGPPPPTLPSGNRG